MASRRPLVSIEGILSELPVGDTVVGATGSILTYSASVNVGSIPIYNKIVSVTDANALTTSKIMAWVQSKSNNLVDELEMDFISVNGICTTNGTIQFIFSAIPGPITGSYTINYTIG
jgi:hypothetical protein